MCLEGDRKGDKERISLSNERKVTPTETANRNRMAQSGRIDPYVKRAIEEHIENFVNNHELDSYEFPSSFFNWERKYIHTLCRSVHFLYRVMPYAILYTFVLTFGLENMELNRSRREAKRIES